MSPEAIATLALAWLRARGLQFTDHGLALSPEAEASMMDDLANVLQVAGLGLRPSRTKTIPPAALAAALEASRHS
jgi:hypothetical protein